MTDYLANRDCGDEDDGERAEEVRDLEYSRARLCDALGLQTDPVHRAKTLGQIAACDLHLRRLTGSDLYGWMPRP